MCRIAEKFSCEFHASEGEVRNFFAERIPPLIPDPAIFPHRYSTRLDMVA